MPPFSQIEHQAARRRQARVAIAGSVAAIALVAVAVLVARPGDGGGDPQDLVASPGSTTTALGDETTTTEPPVTTTTTEEPTRPTSTTAPHAVVEDPPPGTAVWTAPAGLLPQGAAKQFARVYLGMTEFVVGEFQQGDSRSGEVAIRPSTRPGAPETVVLLRQIVDGRWSVVAANARDIRVVEPAPGHVDGTPPVRVSGEGRAFEGTIDVEVRTQDEVLGKGFVTAGGGEEYLPFAGDIEYRKPSQRIAAAVVFTIYSAEDGSVMQASAVPIQVG